MSKILSRSGASLADIYDIGGSIAGIEDLNSSDVSLVHEMGQAIFSERLRATIRLAANGNVLQSVNWDVVVTGLPTTPASRINGIVVVASVTARISHCTVSIRNPGNGREIPLWAWDATADIEITWRGQVDGGAIANNVILIPAVNQVQLPSMLLRGIRGDSGLPEIVFRGRSTAFGAGNILAQALFTTYQPLTGDPTKRVPSNEGLPLPSW